LTPENRIRLLLLLLLLWPVLGLRFLRVVVVVDAEGDVVDADAPGPTFLEPTADSFDNVDGQRRRVALDEEEATGGPPGRR
jgi:hypothetical protein